MKKKNILLGVMGVLLLTSCDNGKPIIKVNNGGNKDNDTGTVVPNINTDKIYYRYYSDKIAYCPFIQDYTMAELFEKYEVRCSLDDKHVTNFDDFSYTFTCGYDEFTFDKTVDVLSSAKVSEAFLLIEEVYKTEDYGRYIYLTMRDSNNVSFSQKFFYDYYIPDFAREANYPEVCSDIKIPQYEGEKAQYYIYDISNTNEYPFWLRVYGSNKQELDAYYDKLVQEGYTNFIPTSGYDDIVKIYEKAIDDENVLHLEIVASCNRSFILTNTYEYDLCGDIIIKPKMIRKAKSDAVTYQLPEELTQYGIPEFMVNGVGFTFEEGETNLLFVYNLSSTGLYEYFKKLEELGFEKTIGNYVEGLTSYVIRVEQINKKVAITQLTNSYCSYNVLQIDIR
ncbi:MAG: hypothetical protein J6T15_07680 [Bacilli bacterium]|nr:hypothetical protein [Bacilli bacterium]